MDELVLTVGDIKQYFYCSRIVYFRYLMPNFHPITYKMQEGKLRQHEEQRLEHRRTLYRFGIKGPMQKGEGENIIQRLFNLRITSQRLGLVGVMDMAIITPEEVIPIDFKDGAFSVGEVVALHHKYQLLAYGLLLEEAYVKRCRRGFVCSLEDGKTKSVSFTEGARVFLKSKIKRIREMILKEVFPPMTPYWWRCRECEFQPICIG